MSSNLIIDAANVKRTVSNTLFGLFWEDINYSYDGGLNENMVRNFSFDEKYPKKRKLHEYEANIIASEILLDNDELLDLIYSYRYSTEQIARQMHTDINLVAQKIAHLNELGYDLRPLEHRNDFLK